MTAALAIGPADVAFRPAGQADVPFVLNSWLQSYARAPLALAVPREAYWRGHHDLVLAILGRCETTVACAPSDPDAIMGWATTWAGGVHYVYVKFPYRRLGIARRLLEHLPERSRYTHQTAIVASLPVPREWEFDPYPAWSHV